MATHKLIMEDCFEEAFSVIAIHSTLPDYRLAYYLNGILSIQLIQIQKIKGHAYFEFNDERSQTTWSLIKNKAIVLNEIDIQNTSLFDFKGANLTTYLVPEFKKVDYLLIINPIHQLEENIVLKIKTIPQIITTFVINTEHLKSKNNLIFY